MQSPNRRDQALALAEETLTLLETGGAPLSSILLRCIRIARLLEAREAEDYFQLESRGYKAAFVQNQQTVAKAQMWSARRVPTSPDNAPMFYTDSIEVIEVLLATHQGHLDSYRLPTTTISEVARQDADQQAYFGYRPPALSVTEKVISQVASLRDKSAVEVMNLTRIISAVRGLTQVWLAQETAVLKYGSFVESALDRRRKAVEDFLSVAAPGAAAALAASAVRAAEGDSESTAQALTSCRRALKALADAMYPPPADNGASVGEDLSDAMYRNRLKRIIRESGAGAKARKLMQINLDQTCDLVDSVDRLDSKGIHSEVGVHEVEMAILHTYLLIGDVLSLAPTQTEEAHSLPSVEGADTSTGAAVAAGAVDGLDDTGKGQEGSPSREGD